MTRLELLASQLDAEAHDVEIKNVQMVFSKNLSFWNLCMDAKNMLMEMREKDAENIPREDSKVEVGA